LDNLTNIHRQFGLRTDLKHLIWIVKYCFSVCIGPQTSVIIYGDFYLLTEAVVWIVKPYRLSAVLLELYLAKIKNVSDLFLWLYNLHIIKSYIHRTKYLLANCLRV
jgi:hypothetical protein